MPVINYISYINYKSDAQKKKKYCNSGLKRTLFEGGRSNNTST